MRNQYFQNATQRTGPLNGTPIRGRSQNFKNFNSVRQPTNKQNGELIRNISPNNMNNMRKPGFNNLPSTQYSPRNQPNNIFQKYTQFAVRCVTHAMKRAQYQIQVEGDIYQYCQTCAVHLVNQGFDALKIGQSEMMVGSGKKSLMYRQGSKKNYGYQPRQLPYYPQFQSNKNYHQIVQFLKFLYSVEENHFLNIEEFQTFQTKFEEQITSTQQYYDNLLEIITQMRQDHLYDLYQETQRYTQIAEIQVGHLRDNLTQIDAIRVDIENNLQAIITKVDQQSFQNCVDFYRQRAYVYKVHIQQQDDTFKQVQRFTNHDIKQKIDRVIEFLKDVWKQPDYQSKQIIKENLSPTHFAQRVHQRLPSSNSQRKLNSKPNQIMQGQYMETYQVETEKPACRSLFDAQQSNQAVASPQFKNF